MPPANAGGSDIMLERHQRETGWADRAVRTRGARALRRQLEYQEHKAAAFAGHEDEMVRGNFVRAQQIRKLLDAVKPFDDNDRVLEVGSGAHGLVFGFGTKFGVGIDPLAVEYKRLFPHLQANALTAAAIGEELPFADAAFDVVLSDNVIDHAERPLAIVPELIRVLKPGGLLYFTVNVHHPLYNFASNLHGAWNAIGVKVELSAFADHTIHLTEDRISAAFVGQPLEIISKRSTVDETRSIQRSARALNPDSILKKVFFKNALFELIAKRA